MSTVPGCGHCDRPVPDGASICSTCTTGLAEALRGVPALVDDLLITLVKQDKLGSGAGKGRNEQPLPLRLDIPDAVWVLGNVVTTWARDLAETAGLQVDASRLARAVLGPAEVASSASDRDDARCELSDLPVSMCAHCRGHQLAAGVRLDEQVTTLHQSALRVVAWRPPTALGSLCFAARWLAEHSEHLRRLPAAAQAHDEITDALKQANTACSAPPLRMFVGACDKCDADLYGWPDHRAVKCRRCGTEYRDMAQRWDRALLKLRGYPATAGLIAQFAGELYGQKINRKRINDWHYRGTLRKVDDDPDTGDPRFRIGAVLDKAAQSKPRKPRN